MFDVMARYRDAAWSASPQYHSPGLHDQRLFARNTSTLDYYDTPPRSRTEEPAMIKKEIQGDNFYQGYYTPPRDWVPRTNPYIAFGPIQDESLQSKATVTFGREGAGGDSGITTPMMFQSPAAQGFHQDERLHTNRRPAERFVEAAEENFSLTGLKCGAAPVGTGVSVSHLRREQQRLLGHHPQKRSQITTTCHREPYSPLSSFHSSNPSLYNQNTDAMSLSYETRQFPQYPAQFSEGQMQDPQMQDDELQHEHEHRYPSPPPPMGNIDPYTSHNIDAGPEPMEMPELRKDESDVPSPRSKPIPKPDREATKNEAGRYVCSWVGCTEEVRDFGRKCEWSKHMDKHDRPYKCPAEGCEKLPGFTYSGGLLRHEREVHNKHGGPRKQLNCPHPNCKRHSGKGFSRQENLNEHLRRVHTDSGIQQNGEETEDDGSEKAGQKRKRGSARGDSVDLREEMKRLRAENEELRRQSEAQTVQTAEMMRQIQQLQNAMHPRIPQAPMM